MKKILPIWVILFSVFTLQACADNLKPGTEFQDCEDCPVMMVLPQGEFTMGAVLKDKGAKKYELPNVKVKIDYNLAVGKFELTRREFMACVKDGGCSYSPKEKTSYELIDGKMTGKILDGGKWPVVDVNWYDTQQYVKWLSRKTGRHYRLLTEAEWEYAARGGTDTIFWWGDEVGVGNAICMDCQHQMVTDMHSLSSLPSPVGVLKPNPFGLYDTSGNVSEWVEDCWTPNVQGNILSRIKAGEKIKCKAYPEHNVFGGRRIIRDGSVGLPSRFIRSSSRRPGAQKIRLHYHGFRIVTDDLN